VDADDLVAFAAVLGVAPADLLLAPDGGRDVPDHAALSTARNLTARIEQLLAVSGGPEAPQVLSGYVDRALRRVQIEVEELLAETHNLPGDRQRSGC
jgi:hypothetical protein